MSAKHGLSASSRGTAAVSPGERVRIGDVIAGKYRVERVVGEGGVGLVVEATHLQLEQRVALKMLRQESLENADVVARFSREARAAVKLKGDHVARVTDVASMADGTDVIVMEYLEGCNLGTLLTQRGRIADVTEAAEYMLQACEALAEAHSLGIVHRDIKPENLFLVQRPGALRFLKLLDFGISKASATDIDLSSPHTIGLMGSPYYMAPEQLRSKEVDGRLDIWALGVVLFEMLAGELPFESTDFTALVAEILESPHRRLSDFRRDIPDGLEEIVDTCLEKDRNRRFANAAELAAALMPFAPARARAHVERAAEFAAYPLRVSGIVVPTGSDRPRLPSRASSNHARLRGSNGTGRRALHSGSNPVPSEPPRQPSLRLVKAVAALAAVACAAGAGFLVARSPTPVAESRANPIVASPNPTAGNRDVLPTSAVGSADPHLAVAAPASAAPAAVAIGARGAMAARPAAARSSKPSASTSAKSSSEAPLPTASAPPAPATAERKSTMPALDADPWRPATPRPKLEDNPWSH